MPDIKEKLVKLILSSPPSFFLGASNAYMIADHLIANGVTVQDGKTLEAFLHPKGLKAKYLVFKADTGEMVENCFILRPDKDPAAVEALRAYANATDNKTLAEDIYSWVGKGAPVQEWISVKERLPDNHRTVLIACKGTTIGGAAPIAIGSYGGGFWSIADVDGAMRLTKYMHCIVTHWMPLPEPPKGEYGAP